MGKQQVTMTIDSDVADEFQRLFPNERSGFCNEMMRVRIASVKGDVSGLKLDLLLHKESELKQRIDALNSELAGISGQISIVKENQSKIKEQQLREEQERLDALTTCSGCGGKMDKPHVEVDDQKFCKNCFLNENPKLLEAMKGKRK